MMRTFPRSFTLPSAILMATAMAAGLSACGGSDGEPDPVGQESETGTGGETAGAGTGGDSDGAGSGGEGNPDVPTPGECPWPEGQAAVSLTYDDAMPTQLSTAAPALRAHNLQATFFITDVRNNMAPWAALMDDGHELAAHTFLHPCPAADWVPEGNSSQEYDLLRMETELDEQVTMLRDLGQPEPFTFAYPCGVTWVGEAQESYIPLVEARFSAARGVSSSIAGLSPDMMNVPAFFLSGTADAMIAQVDAAMAASSWVVFGFHGIGGDWEITPAESHEALLQYLDDRRDEVFVAPFGTVVQCLSD